MIVYITAEFPFVLKRKGAVTESAADNLCKAEASENEVIEICPLSPVMPRWIRIDDSFLKTRDKTMIKADLGGGAFIKLLAPKEQCPFTLVEQKRFKNALITVYKENGLKISIETNSDFILFSPDGDDAKITELNIGGETFVAVECEKRLAIFTADGKTEKVFDGAADGFSYESGLVTKTEYKDMAKHVLTTHWKYSGGAFTPERSSLTKSETFSPGALPHKLLPYAFAEALLTGDDLSPYLSDSMKGNAEALKSYFGEFIGVFPPPAFKSPYRPALLYKRAENVYYCKYLECEFAGRAITNVRLSEF